MQAAATRLPRAVARRQSQKMEAQPQPLGADGMVLLNALPIAAAIFTLNDGKLWVEAMNARFLDLAACHAAPDKFAGTFKQYASGQGGAFTRAFLENPATARDEIEISEGEGIGRRFLKLKVSPLSAGSSGVPRCLLSVVDRTIEVQAENNLRAEMLRDSLTGLPNRLGFSEAIEKAGEQPSRTIDHAVLVVDMLRFSRINESMGSLAGDELLITFARRLILALRAGDILARTGGNEFGILVSLRRGVEDALKAADRINKVMAAPFKISDLEIRVECAIGVALMQAGQDSEELFRNAQFAVKQAKTIGRPQVYEPKQATEARRRFSIETELRRALDRDQLDLF
jgi:diguanylate cyclase (GGDEF)-like protein